MKKTLLILTTLFVSLIGNSQIFTDNYINYQVTSTTANTVQVTSYDIAGGVVVDIPNMVVNNSITYSVTGIAGAAFYLKNITSITIPNSVISIGSNAFNGNNLTSIILPNQITIIEAQAFSNNSLSSITIPNSVTHIGSSAFRTNQLTNIVIPNSVIDIAFAAFRDNPLASVISEAATPASIYPVGINDSFHNRSAIDLTIPSGSSSAYVTALWTGFNSVTEAGGFVVGDTFVEGFITYEVTSIAPDTVEAIDYDMAGGTVVDIPATVPNTSFSVTSIGSSAFASNLLSSVTMPNSISSIGVQAFWDNALVSVVIPNNVTIIKYKAFQFNQLTSVSLSSSLITIEEKAFITNDITSITIPNSVTTIGVQAFANNDITTVIIPDSVTTLNDYAFADNLLTSISIPNSLTQINQAVFRNNQLTSVTIPNSITSIGIRAFDVNQLTNITFSNNLLTIGQHAFQSNQLTNIDIPDTVTSIGNEAFRTNQLTSVTIPSNVTSIGTQAFINNPLTDVITKNSTPPTITTGGSIDTFNSDRSSIHLHIPAGTMGAYVTDAGALWTGFNPVTEDVLSVSDFELANTVKVITNNDAIKIVSTNSLRLQNYTIYNISGAKVSIGKENEIVTSSFAEGIYILKLDFYEGTVIKKIVIN